MEEPECDSLVSGVFCRVLSTLEDAGEVVREKNTQQFGGHSKKIFVVKAESLGAIAKAGGGGGGSGDGGDGSTLRCIRCCSKVTAFRSIHGVALDAANFWCGEMWGEIKHGVAAPLLNEDDFVLLRQMKVTIKLSDSLEKLGGPEDYNVIIPISWLVVAESGTHYIADPTSERECSKVVAVSTNEFPAFTLKAGVAEQVRAIRAHGDFDAASELLKDGEGAQLGGVKNGGKYRESTIKEGKVQEEEETVDPEYMNEIDECKEEGGGKEEEEEEEEEEEGEPILPSCIIQWHAVEDGHEKKTEDSVADTT